MSLIVRGAKCSPDTNTAMFAEQVSGDLFAGEAIIVGSPCYIKSSDGKVYNTNGTAANEAAKCDGFAGATYAAGEAITLLGRGTRFNYGSGLTIGANLYAGATAGRLDDAPTTGGTIVIARVVTSTDIRVFNLS
jgi:hypothetical protein